MRVLSRAEASVVASLMSGSTPSLTDANGSHSLPRRTRETVLRRVFLREWIVPRRVPVPAAVGRPFVTVALSQPFAERRAACAALWKGLPGSVHLWTSPDALLGVFLSPDATSAARVRGIAEDAQQGLSHIALTMDVSAAPVPVYFDFELGWARFADLAGTASYPQSLPRSRPEMRIDPLRSTRKDRDWLRELIEEPLLPAFRFGSRRVLHPNLPTRVERRFIERGWVEPRSFLDPLAVGQSVSGFPRKLAFVWGRLNAGSTPEDLFRSLVEKTAVAPFLYCHAEGRVLIGTLAEGEAIVRPLQQPSASKSPLPILEQHLADIVSVRMTIEEVGCTLNHRYDHLFETNRGTQATPDSEWKRPGFLTGN